MLTSSERDSAKSTQIGTQLSIPKNNWQLGPKERTRLSWEEQDQEQQLEEETNLCFLIIEDTCQKLRTL